MLVVPLMMRMTPSKFCVGCLDKGTLELPFSFRIQRSVGRNGYLSLPFSLPCLDDEICIDVLPCPFDPRLLVNVLIL